MYRRKKYPTRQCSVCNADFTPMTVNQLACTYECRAEHQRRRIKRQRDAKRAKDSVESAPPESKD